MKTSDMLDLNIVEIPYTVMIPITFYFSYRIVFYIVCDIWLPCNYFSFKNGHIWPNKL